MPRRQPCTAATRAGRLRKAEQFIDAASTVAALADNESDVRDACVTLLVHGGIASADVTAAPGSASTRPGRTTRKRSLCWPPWTGLCPATWRRCWG